MPLISIYPFSGFIFLQGYIFCKILWLGRGEWCREKRKENEAVRNKMKKKEKGKRKKGKEREKKRKGGVIFLLIYGTLLLTIVY